MGQFFSNLFRLFTSKKEYRLLMLGLDAAGKTTILYKLKLAEFITTIPTIGFNAETVEYKNLSFTIWDVGGQDKIRVLWRHYFLGTSGLIFVVDSNDHHRLDQARKELDKLLSTDELRNVTVLVLANKQDLPQALNASEISKGLHLDAIKKQQWYIQPCSAVENWGLYEGLDWLASALQQHN